jgi:hypothetical protein
MDGYMLIMTVSDCLSVHHNSQQSGQPEHVHTNVHTESHKLRLTRVGWAKTLEDGFVEGVGLGIGMAFGRWV